MSKLYGSLNADASKTLATKRGHKYISAHIRSWTKGIEVSITEVNGKFIFRVYETCGSGGSGPSKLVYTTEENVI